MKKYTAKFYISEDSHHTIAFQFNSMIFHEKSSNFVYICILAYSVFKWKISTAYCVKYLREGVHMSSQNRFVSVFHKIVHTVFFWIAVFYKNWKQKLSSSLQVYLPFCIYKKQGILLWKLVDKIWFFFSVELLNLFYGTKGSKVYSQWLSGLPIFQKVLVWSVNEELYCWLVSLVIDCVCQQNLGNVMIIR